MIDPVVVVIDVRANTEERKNWYQKLQKGVFKDTISSYQLVKKPLTHGSSLASVQRPQSVRVLNNAKIFAALQQQISEADNEYVRIHMSCVSIYNAFLTEVHVSVIDRGHIATLVVASW